MKFLITGGAGFIGSALIRYILNHTSHSVCNIDKLSYSGNLENLKSVSENANYEFRKIDICDSTLINQVFSDFQPDYVIHLAAESHVDKSITESSDFINTNILGTHILLEASRQYLDKTPSVKNIFKFIHVSTDEVYGALGTKGSFTEDSPYKTNSPYSASKAASDHLVQAWHSTYELPTIITHCSNNYGPYQFPEKLIPQTIIKALSFSPIPVYGQGLQIRDWLYVDDHVGALYKIATEGKVGEVYNIGGNSEEKNIDVVNKICNILDQQPIQKPANSNSFSTLINFVEDRPGHDFRYSIDPTKITTTLGWKPSVIFEDGLLKTVLWYLEHHDWWSPIVNKKGENQ